MASFKPSFNDEFVKYEVEWSKCRLLSFVTTVIESQILELFKVSMVFFAIEAAKISRSDELIIFASLFFEDENFLIGINAETFIYFDSSLSMIVLASAFFLSRLFITKSAICTSYPRSFNS